METNNMIYIIGAGTIGKSLAVFLKNAGRDVMLVRGSIDDGSMQTETIRVEAGGEEYEAAITVRTLSTLDALKGIIVLANKSYGNEQLAQTLRLKTGSSPLVLLQNGLGVERPFLANGFPEVYRCVLFVTSQSTDSGGLRFRPVSMCPVGVEKGNAGTLEKIVNELSTPNFQFKSEENIQSVIWKKAIVNSVFNSVCPLLETDNGIFYRNEAALAIARTVIAECVAVAEVNGIAITASEVEESLLKISRSSDGQLISTLQDIRAKRRTEIDTLNFEIARVAGNISVTATGLLGELVKIKSGYRAL
ncbi:2-dehydropantoate 2-reductase [Nostoc ellipsosporum NOK]|nr:2-dehydropantoate 2-reductase [Nostoc ellipsosporum NOK]